MIPRSLAYSPGMLHRQRPLQFGAEPSVITSLQAGGRASRLEGSPHLHRLAWGRWAVREEPLSALERAVLLQKHLGRPDAPLAVSGVHGLHLLQLPVGRTETWIEEFLGTHESSRSRGVPQEGAPVLLVWREHRVQTRQAGVRIGRSKGLPTMPGPWDSTIAHPVESLAWLSRSLPSWRLTACLDAIISTAFSGPGAGAQRTFAPEEVISCLEQLPPHSSGALRLRRAWEDARFPCWSPAETLTRLTALRCGLPEPDLNHEVSVAGRKFLLDLAWPRARVAVEYNGSVHAREIQQYRDEMYRLSLLRDAGWDVTLLSWDDLRIPARRTRWVERVRRGITGTPLNF